jgi:hypothetical protein
MIVMMMAITPSVNAVSLSRSIQLPFAAEACPGRRAIGKLGLERVAQKWTPVLRLQRAQTFEFRARFNDQAIPPDRIVL